MNPISAQFQSPVNISEGPAIKTIESSQESLHDQLLRSTQLFSNNHQRLRIWEALLLAAHNKKEEAKSILEAVHDHREPQDIPSWNQAQPTDIEVFFDKLFIHDVWRNPQKLSLLGLFESIGFKDHNAHLNDYSLSFFDDNFEEKKKLLGSIINYDPETLTPDQKISYQVFLWQLNHAVAGEKFQFHKYLVNQMWGILQEITMTLTMSHKLEELSDFENYICRLDQISIQLRQTEDLMEYQRKKGIIPPRFAIQKTAEQCKKMWEAPIDTNIFYTYLESSLDKNPIREKEAILEEAKHVVENGVRNAYHYFYEYCMELLETANANDGVWALPYGDEYYAHALAEHTTTDMSANEIHELGLQEVQRLEGEIRAILAKENILVDDKEIGEQIHELSKREDIYYPNTDEGRKKCLEDFEFILEKAREKLWPLFDTKPKLPVQVKQLPKELEQGSPLAFYLLPSLDGSREGIFYVNTCDLRQLPMYEMETLAMHEAEPGHHFQVAIQYGLEIPVLRKLSTGFTAYVEGWALYAEKLAYEEGFYSSSLDKIGHLKFDLWRAARLVVDTGIHHKGWTKDQAIRYMTSITGTSHTSAETEIERYFVMPGQACAYKIGQLKILELRQRAKEMLGDKFKIQEFHNVVLNLGAVPLTILEEAVDLYIQRVNS